MSINEQGQRRRGNENNKVRMSVCVTECEREQKLVSVNILKNEHPKHLHRHPVLHHQVPLAEPGCNETETSVKCLTTEM